MPTFERNPKEKDLFAPLQEPYVPLPFASQDICDGDSRYYQTAPRTSRDNKYTGATDVAKSTDKFEQQFTTLGIPTTDKSWAMQDRIDGGKLHITNNLHFLEQVPAQLKKGLDLDGFRSLANPNAHTPEERERLARELNCAVRRLDDDPTVRRGFDEMSKRGFTSYQSGILDDYIGQAARAGNNATFILDLMPTELKKKRWLDFSPENFMVGDYILNTREITAQMAEGLRSPKDPAQRPHETYGLVVPYSNTAENIVYRGGIPRDGSENLGNYVREIEGRSHGAVRTVASGYSQGATAVLNYVQKNGAKDGLDNAIALAPMGGTDLNGQTGINYGELGATAGQRGVQTLGISHQDDPARRINRSHGFASVLSGAIKFVGASQEESDIHAGVHWDNDPWSGQARYFPELGTKGYAMEHVLPLEQQLLSGQLSQDAYQHRGTWDGAQQIQNFKRKPQEDKNKPANPGTTPQREFKN